MDPYRFQRRIDAEKKIEELKAALNSSDVGKKDEALKQELNMLRAEVEALKKEVSISTPPPAGNAISHRDAQLLQWLKALRTILSNKVGNMKSWVLRFDQNSDGKIDKGEFKGLLQTYYIDADKEQLDELWGAFSGGSSTVSVSELTKAIDGCDELYRNIRRANSAKWTDNKASAKAGARETVWDESRFQNAQMTYGQR
mmetsp:Transcript_24319/g.43144  ORF Transcript_24319/g.43144 Transcript_24319/m.43144 type:complete len:199 (+) Transcript_24319:221-817(+)